MISYLYPPTPVSVSVPSIEFVLNGVATSVSRDTATPGLSNPLPIINLDSSGNPSTPLTDTQLRATAVPVSGPLTDAQIRATALPVSIASQPLPTGAATETTLAALNTKVASNYGVATGAIRTASQIGNTTGAAAFNAGADSAQTLRVSANLKRAGVELSYGAGVSDVNTPRVNVASDSNLAKESKQDAGNASLVSVATQTVDIPNVITTEGGVQPSKGVMVMGHTGASVSRHILVENTGRQVVNVTASALPTGAATEATLAALNTKVANNYGVATGAVRTAAQVGNAGGAADFSSGADSAQTLRVSANLKRAGNELSYGAGVSDANTQRVNVASDSNLAKESQITTLLANTANRVINSVVNFTTSNASITAPAGAKGFIIQNSITAAGALRWNLAGAATASAGFYLGTGQSTSYIDGASNLSIFDVDAAGIDACIVWFT